MLTNILLALAVFNYILTACLINIWVKAKYLEELAILTSEALQGREAKKQQQRALLWLCGTAVVGTLCWVVALA